MDESENNSPFSNFMRVLRAGLRVVHRNIAFLFMGTTLIYALSGMAFNHLADWDPNQRLKETKFKTDLDLNAPGYGQLDNIKQLVKEVAPGNAYSGHSKISDSTLKIKIRPRGYIIVDKNTGQGALLSEVDRELFVHINKMHKNPNPYWKWFADFYAITLILLTISGFIMTNKGFFSSERLLLVIGFIIPVVIYSL